MQHCSQKCVAYFYSERLPLREAHGSIISCYAWNGYEGDDTGKMKD